MKVILAALIFCICHMAAAQDSYPMDAFRPPLDIPLILAGNFGELRSNHFHSGIDIKTQQREGLSVHAIGDGTITRIKVSLWGYGKVLYVAHPNGYTSVYGHLQKFSPSIEAYIKKIQYEKQAYEVEVFPDYGELRVVQGEVIAYSGNTGSSAGPHLHFEIRNSISERPTNPLLFGLDVRDATSPTLQEVFAYPLSNDARLNQSNGKIQLRYSRQPDGTYLADPLHASGTIGFGLAAYDRQDLAANRNGVYRVRQLVNGSVYTDFSFDSFSFSESRYINTLIDYEHYARYYDRIQRMFRVQGNRLDIYKTLQNDGKLVVREGLTYNVDLELRDIEGNTTQIRIPVEGRRDSLQQIVEKEKTDDYLLASKPNNYDLGIAKVYFPAGTFYEDLYLRLQKGADTVMIHDNTVPVHRNFTITFDVSKYAPEKRRQLFIARLNERLQPEYETTYKRGNTFTTRTRDLGTYTLATDSIPPKIWAKNFKENQWLTNFHYLRLHISDDLSGVDTYTAHLNGQWILMEYEPKSNTLTYNFDDRIEGQTQCQLEVTVTDNVGNKSTYSSSFYRK
jgi:murein DD-endopeptidase MepM/ murein hydrolase activator NlpD